MISVKDEPYKARGDGLSDDTWAIQSALNDHRQVFIPEGTYLVKPDSLLLRSGQTLLGEGEEASIIYPTAEAGSVFKRSFTFTGSNLYVENIHISGISIVLNHPMIADSSNYKQIGFDFRNITRSTIERCYVGNYNRGDYLARTRVNPKVHEDAIQGWGIVFGNVSSSDTAYAGGEVNRVLNCRVHGAMKAIVTDDENLSPASAAHACIIRDCDVQICESGIAIESKYTAGSVIRDNTVQAVGRARSSSSTTYVYRIEGYSCVLAGGYTEVTLDRADHLIYLGKESKANDVQPFYYSDSRLKVTDEGTGNTIRLL